MNDNLIMEVEIKLPVAAVHSEDKSGIGLGDVVAAAARPVVWAVNLTLDSRFKNCRGCMQRKATLNKHVPDVTFGLAKNFSTKIQ